VKGRVHAKLGSLLVLGGIGLTVGAVWAAGIPTYACAEGVPRPTGWIYAGLVLFAAVALIAALVAASRLGETPILAWIYVGIALVEAAAASWLVVFLRAKYSHYQCG